MINTMTRHNHTKLKKEK
jgi:hypothetical protein